MLTEGAMLARLQRALDFGNNTHTLQDVFAALKTGEMQCFWSDNAFVVTQICEYPQKRVLLIPYLAGELDEVMSLQPQVVEHAKASGCSDMMVIARRGWEKVLPKFGWTRSSTVFDFKVG
jgi:hypothetical protein